MSTDIHALSGAYAVDALDPNERADFEQHLAGCDSCRAEVAGLREAATHIAETTMAAPPAALRAQVLAGIEHIRPLPPQIRAGRTHWSLRQRLAPLLVAAVVALGLIMWQPWQGGNDNGRQLSAVSQIQQASDAHVVTQSLTNGASVTWYHSTDLGRTALVVHKMPKLSTDKVYELWLQNPAGQMVPAGFLTPKSGNTVVLDDSVDAPKGAGITVEPAGGSPAPTTTPITTVSFA